nr:hypothetical protein [Limosilactobacillus reuteri]
MLGSGVARAVDIAAASLPGFTLPNDISSSQQYFEKDIITPEITQENGKIMVPTATGIGYDLNWAVIHQYTTETATI